MKKLLTLIFAAALMCSGCEKEEEKEAAKSAACEITAFTVNGKAWRINNDSITCTFPVGTAKTSLAPVIIVSEGAVVNPASGTAQNFFTDAGVTYVVAAADGTTTKTYIAKATVAAEEEVTVDSGATGACSWTLTGDPGSYTLTISGNGAMANYSFYAPWTLYGSDLKTLVIQDGVTTIGENAFQGCDGLTSVTIPNSVITIGEGAFAGCKGLTSVTIGNSVTTIGESAFENCDRLSNVTIGNSVTTIGEYAFYGCKGLTSVTIGNSVTTIGEYAFYNCSSLTSVTNLRTTPQSISNGVFAYTVLSTCTLRVPASAVAAYKAAEVWQDFGTTESI
jgi:hypothetical protein